MTEENETVPNNFQFNCGECGYISRLCRHEVASLNASCETAREALRRILKKSPQKVGRAEAADMSIEFQMEARIALEAIEGGTPNATLTKETKDGA